MISSRATILVSLVLLAAATGRAEDVPARLKIDYANVRWQHAPREVQGVYIGPDGRTWYQLGPEMTGWSLAQIKSRLQREWKETAPQISGVRLALLEPGGRVWFQTEFGRSLLGYDGLTWVEYKGSRTSPNLGGECATQGSFPHNRTNRFAGGKAWFSASGGIHVFDGEHWSVQEFVEPGDITTTSALFAVSSNGKFAAAIYGNDQTLWTCLEGKWTKGRNLKNEKYPVERFFVTNQGLLWYRHFEELRFVSLPGAATVAEEKEEEEEEAKQVAILVKQLGDDSFDRREEASTKLAQLGETIVPDLAAALKAATDVEIKVRLKKLLDKAAPRGFKPPVVTRIGKYRVSEVKHLGQDDRGTLCIAAGAIRLAGGKTAPGLLLLDAAGEATLVRNPAGLEPWWLQDNNSGLSFYLSSSKGLWLAPYPSISPAAFLDVKENKLTEELPDLRPARVVAVDSAGRVFAAGDYRVGPVLVFTPGAPEDRQSLPTTSFPIARTSFPFVALDGSIWAQRKVEGLSRFDGQDWTTVDPGETDTFIPVTSGEEGVVLYEGQRKLYGGKGKYYLFQGGKLLGKGNIRDLAKEHRTLLVKAFATPRSSRYSPQQAAEYRPEQCAAFAADKAGNLWLLEENGKAAVLAGDVWLNATEPLQAAGASQGGARFMAPFGDNSRIYFSNMAGKSQIGEVRDGKLVCLDAPNMIKVDGLPCGLREPGGPLWVAGMGPNSFGQLTHRIGQNGQAQEMQESGWPMLVDESGNAWLGKLLNQPQNKLKVWRGGKIVQHLEIPGTDRVMSLFSDKPGSVYAVTSMGLTHLIAEGEGPYRADKTYVLPSAPNFRQPSFSRLGYVVDNTYMGLPPEPQVTLYRLPRE